MKKLFSIVFILLLIMQLPGAVAMAETTSSDVVFTLETVTGARGETVEVEIVVESAVAFNSLALHQLEYDKDVLTFVGFSDYSDMENKCLFPGGFDDTNGVIALALRSSEALTGTVCKIKFTIAEDAPYGDIEIGMASLIKNNSTQYSSTVINGCVTVACPHTNTTEEPETPADCDESGFTAGVYCNDCETYISGHEEIPATGEHVDADGKWEFDEFSHYHTCACDSMFDGAEHEGGEANCIDKAVCAVCGATYGSVNAAKHGVTEVRDASEATCVKDGYTGDTYCKDCGEKIAKGSVIPATGDHVDADGKWESDADNHYHTCDCGEIIDTAAHTGGGATCVSKAVCEVCGIEYGEVDADNHNEEIRNAVAATEESEGYTGDTYCKDCGEKLADGEVTPKLDHTHAMVKTDKKDATHEADGNVEYYTCSKCGKLYKDEAGTQEITIEETVIAKGEHTYETSNDDDKHWEECACGSKINEAAHTYGDWNETKAPTATEKGSKERACSVCGHKQVEELPKIEEELPPQTGDTAMITSLVAVAAVMAIAIVFRKKRIHG